MDLLKIIIQSYKLWVTLLPFQASFWASWTHLLQANTGKGKANSTKVLSAASSVCCPPWPAATPAQADGIPAAVWPQKKGQSHPAQQGTPYQHHRKCSFSSWSKIKLLSRYAQQNLPIEALVASPCKFAKPPSSLCYPEFSSCTDFLFFLH